MPVRKNTLGIERREFLLNRVQEPEIDAMFMTGMSFSQDRYRLARIMIAVVKEKHHFATDFLLKLSGGNNLGIEKSLWKKAARLLPETDNWRGHDAYDVFAKMVRCSARLNTSTATQPIRLYQR